MSDSGNIKQQILRRLREADGFVSGQELSEALGVSRTAVWKAIDRLRAAGYVIEAVQNRGYRLQNDATGDVLNQEELELRLEKATKWVGHPVIFRAETGSTNDDIMQLADEGSPEGTLVVATLQTKGKGRRGRTWISPNNGNVYMSLLLRPSLPTSIAPMVTIVMALAICEACNEIAGVDGGTGFLTGKQPSAQNCGDPEVVPGDYCIFGIKWPNDVVVRSSRDPSWKKMTGILTEMRLEEREIKDVTIGDGLNVNMTGFPAEIRETATSMLLATGHPVQRADLVAACWKHFEKDYEIFRKEGSLADLRPEYEVLLVNRNRVVRVLDPQAPFTGTAIGIDDGGALVVQPEGTTDPAARVFVTAGEVSVRGVEGYV